MLSLLLVAYDDSPPAQRALATAVQLATETGAKLLLVHAYHVPTELEEIAEQVAAGDDYLGRLKQGARHEAERRLLAAKDAIDRSDLDVECLVVEGPPGPAIIELAEDRNADWVVAGQRGRSKLKKLLLGGVSQQVAQQSNRPVLVVP